MQVIGLTGGIASGKSAVAEEFASLGVPVIDADLIARELVEPGMPALDKVCQRFGNNILLENGELDRAALREIIFDDAQARHELEAILHPLIRQTIEERVATLDTCYCIVVIPLLAESGAWPILNRVIVLDCPEDLQRQRLQQRDHVDEALARRMLEAQASREKRRALADDVIDNSGSREQLQSAVRQLDRQYRQACR